MDQPTRRTTTPEVRSELETAVMRLEEIGATPDEIATFVDGWDDLNDDWTVERRTEWLHQSDGDLARELAGIRAEHRFHTTTEEEQAELDDQERHMALIDEAAGLTGSNITRIMEWVNAGDDPTEVGLRASIMLDLETNGQNRPTLVAQLADAATPAADGASDV